MIRTLASTLFLCLVAATAAPGQYVGVAGSYRIGLLEAERLTDNWRSWCACDESGSALAQQTLFTAAFLFAEDSLPVAAGARVGFGTGLSSFVSPDYPALRPDLPADALLQYRESLRSTTLRVDLEGRVRTGGDASLMIGPWFEYALASTLERREQIVSPGGATFLDGRDERDLVGAPEVPNDGLRWGMSLGVSLAVPLSATVSLVPSVVIESDLQGLGQARPGALMLAFGTAVVFDTRGIGGARSQPIVDLPSTSSVSRPTPLAASSATVSLFAIDGGRHLRIARARRERTYRRIVTPMPRTLELPADALADTMSTRREPASLIGATPDEIAARAIDVLGQRMRENPRARLRLVLEAGRGESIAAGRDRARTVREYLVRRWDVDRARIAVTRSAGGSTTAMTPSSRITVAGASTELTMPIVVEWVDERLTLPQLGIDPVIDAPRGIAATNLRLMRSGRTLAEGTVADTAALGELAVDLSDALEGGASAPIVAELEVVDSSGATTRASAELALEVPGETEGGGYDRELITIVLHDDADRMMLAELERALMPGARVTVHVGSGVQGAAHADRVRAMLRRRGVEVDEVVDGGDAGAGGMRVDVEMDGRRH